MPRSPGGRESFVREGFLKGGQRRVARGCQRGLSTERQRQRTNVAVAARQRDEFTGESVEMGEGGRGCRQGGASLGSDPRGQRFKCARRARLELRHLGFHPRHHAFISLCYVRGLNHLNLANGMDRLRHESLHATAILARGASLNLQQVIPQRIGDLSHGTEGEALGLQIGVLDGQFENVLVHLSILLEPCNELSHEPIVDLKPLQPGREGGGVVLNDLERGLGLAGEHDRLLIGIRHHGPVRGPGGLRELNAKLLRQRVGFNEIRQDRRWRPSAPTGHHPRQQPEVKTRISCSWPSLYNVPKGGDEDGQEHPTHLKAVPCLRQRSRILPPDGLRQWNESLQVDRAKPLEVRGRPVQPACRQNAQPAWLLPAAVPWYRSTAASTHEREIPLKEIVRKARLRLLKMHFESGIGHIGGNLSALDMMLTLHHRVMGPDDDFILSKGHAAGALYVTLWSMGRLSDDQLATFHQDGTKLGGHPVPRGVSGVPFALGSLGHGLGLASGMALGKRLRGRPGRVFCLLSDGEWNEGSTWESLIFLAHRNLREVTLLVDLNGLQGFGATAEVANLGSLATKLEEFGLEVREVDGHDTDALERALQAPIGDRPRALVARTTKGHGVSFMENKMEWHYWSMTPEQYATAIMEVSRL